MFILGYFGVILTGILLGLLGGGGSILIVPVLVYLFKITPTSATAYSLFVVGLASLLGMYQYHRLKLINYKIGVIFAVPSFIGVYFARSFIVPSLPNTIFSFENFTINKDAFIMLVFAVIMLLASYSMIKNPKKIELTNTPIASAGGKSYTLIGLEGLFVGTITGFVGAGGGFLIIPALVVLAKIPMKFAVGTSLMIIAAKSLFGFIGDLQATTYIDWTFLLQVSLVTCLGIFVGIALSKKISSEKLKPAFGWFVLFMGAGILLKGFL
ncbi:MAG: sulfite exporter TauE/SafE family protein [Oligoflexales bacterium]|nr:sulfite exporter TauE/SafE family protein [Oligoflexales bacterium]